MDNEVLDIDRFNVVSDEENYYFFRALNMADNSDIERGTTVSSDDGKIEKIRTDRERYEGEAKYKEDSNISLEEVYDHIKMHYRKDTNCISLASNANIAINYGRGSYKDKYVMVKVPKKELGEQTVEAGQYMLQELYSRIEQAVGNLPEDLKSQILNIFSDIDVARETEELQELIKKRYTAKSEEVKSSKAHLRKGIIYNSPKSRISSYQALGKEQLLEVNKVYAKLAVLENEEILKHVIPHSSNSKLRETIGNAFSSTELIHYGEIQRNEIIEVPKEAIDLFALIQQIDGIDKSKVEEIKRALLDAVKNGKEIPEIPETDFSLRDNISIEEMYELTGGNVEYGKADSIVKNMFYLSKARQNAIKLSECLKQILGNDSKFNETIEYIKENGFRIEPEIISRKSGKGVKLSESVNLNLEKDEQILVDEIKKLSANELDEVLQNGGLSNVQDVISKVYGKQNEQIDKSRYYAEAIISQYDWSQIGIEEFKISERNELIKRLQDKNCVDIYENLRQSGVDTKQIPTILLNIATRQGFYEEYEKGNLEQLLNTRQDVLQNSINIELVERFLGYYDVENTEIRLKDYQQRAYDNVNKIFEDHKFAQVILPTGAGKSFVALAQMQKYAEEHPGEKMLYLAPQDEILNQIKNYIIKYVHGKQNTVGKTEDEIIAEIFPNISFETYSGLLAKRGQEVIKEQYGMIVLDELHRTGAKEWEGKIDGLLDNQNKDVKVLGITATPVRDTDGRDMAEETAKKLGYTDEEVKQRKHLASNMTLENAIRMGYVVNPKLVYCKYDLISSGKMDELRAKIDDIEDESKRAEELQKYNELRQKLNRETDDEIGEDARKQLEEAARKNLDNGMGKEEILRQNVKKGGKYIVFIPVTDQGEIEDEDGNRIGTKTGEDKIQAYQEYLNKVFDGTDIVPQLHSLLGSYSKDKNKEELEAFESDSSEETKFMVVMNKANEGLHIDGVDGIVWFRALDENSRILYLQQLGRAIYALDEDNPLPDDKRPVVIDLANNSLIVKIEKEFEDSEPIDDLEALIIVIEWIDEHDGMIPNRESSNKQEQHYYAVLRKMQSKYSKYLDGFEKYPELNDEEKEKIQEIIELASEIDLWDMDLPPILKTRGSKEEFNPFIIEGMLKDFVELEEEVDNIETRKIYEEIINWLETHDGQMPRSVFIENGNRKAVAELTSEEHYQVNLMQRWRKSEEYYILNKYAEQPLENVPEEYREKIEKLRKYGLGLTAYQEIVSWLETHDGQMPKGSYIKNRKAISKNNLTKDEQYQRKLMDRWYNSEEYKILIKYAGQPIEKIPEIYRDKIIVLREYGLEKKTAYEELVEWLETHDGQMPKSSFSKNGIKKTASELTDEEKYQRNLFARFRNTKWYGILMQYKDQSIENVPEEYREKILELRNLTKEDKKTYIRELKIYDEIIEWIETHNGQILQCSFSINGIRKTASELTDEEKYQRNLFARFRNTKWYRILMQYKDQSIENVPEEYREKIATLRKYGLGLENKTTYEEIIEWLETHDGQMPRGSFSEKENKKKVTELTSEEHYQVNLMQRWYESEEYSIWKTYKGKNIDDVPEEYRKMILKLRELIKRKTTSYEEIIEWLKMHDGQMPKSYFSVNGKPKNKNELTNDEDYQKNLMQRWRNTEEYEVLNNYVGQSIENVPEKYREKIAILREYGFGLESKTTYEEIIKWLETHDGQMPQGSFRENGKKKKSSSLTLQEKKQKNLLNRWYNTNEYKVLNLYVGQPIEDVPEKYREKIAKLRTYGLGINPSKLRQAKQQRDNAKSKNNQTKELERQVLEQLKKRGQAREE